MRLGPTKLSRGESPDSVLSQISAGPGEGVPVGRVIAVLLIREESQFLI
jgi:hypothetical protein